MEEFEKTHTVTGDIDENAPEAADLDEVDCDEEDEDAENGELYEKNGNVCEKTSKFRKIFSRRNLPVLLIYARYLYPLLMGAVLLCLSFGELFEFYQSTSVGTISILGLYGATLETVFNAFGEITDSTVLWYAVLQLLGALVGLVAFLLAVSFSLLAAITACRTFRREPNHPVGNRMKVIFKLAFPNRVCLFLANAAYIIPFLYPYYFSFVLERFYYMGIEPEPPIYIKSNPCFWVAMALTAVALILAVAASRFERRRRMNMFLVEHNDDEKLSD